MIHLTPAEDGHTHQLHIAVDVDVEALTDAGYYHALLEQVQHLADQQLCGMLPRAKATLPFKPLHDALLRKAGGGGMLELLGQADARRFYRYRNAGEMPEEWGDRIAVEVLGSPLWTWYGHDYNLAV